MSNTYGGWDPQDPYRGQGPRQQPQQQPEPPQQAQPPQQPQPFDPYGPRDPYGRPANPYGRPDYQPWQRPEQRDPQQAAWDRPQQGYQQAPQQSAPGAPQGQGEPPAGRGLPQYSAVSDEEPAPATDEAPTIGSAWRWGWSAFGASWGVWVLMSLLIGLAQLAVILAFSPSTMDGLRYATDPAAVDAAQAAGRTLEARALTAGGTAVCFLLQALMFSGALAATRTRKVRFRDFFVLRGLGGLVGYALITGVLGFAGTSVPTVGWLVQVVFTLLLLPVPFLLLKGVGLVRAVGGGVGLVLSHIGPALAVVGIFAGLALASLFTCGIGLVVVAPAMLLVGAYLVQRWTGDSVRG